MMMKESKKKRIMLTDAMERKLDQFIVLSKEKIPVATRKKEIKYSLTHLNLAQRKLTLMKKKTQIVTEKIPIMLII
jgi:hypothetical protein